MGRRAAAALAPSGFTLLELVVTLMVLALALAVVGPTIGRSTDTIRVRAEVARFAALLRHAREQAITSRRPHELVVEPAEHRITLRSGEEVRQTRALPEHLSVQADPPPALTVRFEPHGTTSGGAFRVASGNIRYRVTVDALTGRVRTARE
ncbi:MAG TPA: GspH/FimT family pseudopilin [Methylomirabilota bacterium]|jgi:type II secretion system protein H|nr:GspH/FimT family pseudopilin [Methylomirabilota bacterium]